MDLSDLEFRNVEKRVSYYTSISITLNGKGEFVTALCEDGDIIAQAVGETLAQSLKRLDAAVDTHAERYYQ